MASNIFHLEIFGEFLNLDNFRVKFFAPTTGKIALANESYLIVSDGIAADQRAARRDGAEDINTLVEFSELSGKPTALLWIIEEYICVGYDTGTIACFDVSGNILFEKKLKAAPVQVMRVSGVDEGSESSPSEGLLWVMYAKGLLVSIPIASVLAGTDDKCTRFKLVESLKDVSDFVVLPTVYRPRPFDLDGLSDATHSLLVAGDSDAALSLYNIGGEQQFQHLGKLGSYLKSQVSSVLSKTFSSVFGFGSKEEGHKVAAVPIASLIDFEDTKRKILRLRLSPLGDLVAAADSLGRVTLYDVYLNVVVRLWKGVRDARLAWSCTVRESRTFLSLAIYAPQLGLLSFYAMRHGPCLRIVPIPSGSQCQIFTTVETLTGTRQRIAKCWLARGVDGSSDSEPGTPTDTPTDTPPPSDAFSMKLLVTVADPYEQLDDDVDIGLPGVSYSDAREGRDGMGREGREGNSPYVGPSLSSVSDEDMHDCLSSPPAKSSTGAVSTAPSTARDQEIVVRRFKRALRDILYSATEREKEKEQIPHTPHQEGVNPNPNSAVDQILKKAESHLTLLLLSLQSVDALAQCLLLVDCLELTGDVERPGTRNKQCDEMSKSFSFSPDIHRSMYQAMTVLIQISKRQLAQGGGQGGGQGGQGGEQSLLLLDVEMSTRLRLLDAYSSILELNKGTHWAAGTDAESAQSAFEQEAAAALCKQSTHRAEAMCWLRQAAGRCEGVTGEGMSGVDGAEDHEGGSDRGNGGGGPGASSVSGPIPFALYRALHGPGGGSGSGRGGSNRKKEDSPIGGECSLSFGLKLLLNALVSNGPIAQLDVDGFTAYRRVISDPPIRFILSLSVSHPVCVRAIQFLVAPLLGGSVGGDVFGLQSFTLALEASSLSSPIAVRELLPCAVMYLETCGVRMVGSNVLLRDISSSPLQRWLRDSLLGLYDDFIALSLERQMERQEQQGEDRGDREGRDDTPRGLVGVRARQSMLALLAAMREGGVLPTASERERESDGQSGSDKDQGEGDGGLLLFDDCIRYLLRRAWCAMRRSKHLEVMLALAAVVCETLSTVSEQVSRRSYGVSSLLATVTIWENLYRQLRVTLILTRHIVALGAAKHAETVRDFETRGVSEGNVGGEGAKVRWMSVYRVLALDTLSFTLRADHAVHHENQCREVHTNKGQGMGQGQSLGGERGQGGMGREGRDDGVLSAWGASADTHWRDLLSHAPVSIAGEWPRGEENVPLLSFFPQHNQPSILGVYRALELTARWIKSPCDVSLLKAAGEHLLSLAAVTRAAAAEAILTEALLPLLRRLIDFDTRDPIVWDRDRGDKDRGDKGRNMESTYNDNWNEMSSVLKDMSVSDTFTRAATELLAFAEQGSSSLQRHRQTGQSGAPSIPALSPSVSLLERAEGARIGEMGGMGGVGVMEEDREIAEQVTAWPAIEDPYLSSLVVGFHARGGCDIDTLHVHIAMLRVLQMRTLLQLGQPDLNTKDSKQDNRQDNAYLSDTSSISKTVLPMPSMSLLFGRTALGATCSSLSSPSSLPSHPSPVKSSDSMDRRDRRTSPSPLDAPRYDFIRFCFQKMVLLGGQGDTQERTAVSWSPDTSTGVEGSTPRIVAAQAAVVCYQLVNLWGLSVQRVRVMHMAVLLDADSVQSQNGQYGQGHFFSAEMSDVRDFEVENLLPLITDSTLVVNLLIAALRRRVGILLTRIESLPRYGHLLATTDSDAVAWCLNWDRGPDSRPGSSPSSVIGSASHSTKSETNPPIDGAHGASLGSTRNLVARTQILLKVSPMGADRSKACRAQCGALLLLCEMLSHVN